MAHQLVGCEGMVLTHVNDKKVHELNDVIGYTKEHTSIRLRLLPAKVTTTGVPGEQPHDVLEMLDLIEQAAATAEQQGQGEHVAPEHARWNAPQHPMLQKV